MSVTVIDERIESLEDREVDWVPVGHIAELEWLLSDRTTRPTRALCGAEILGIPADVDHVKCEDCWELIERELGNIRP